MASPQPSAPAPRNELVVPKGTVIFRQGDPGDSMFIIERGRVRIVLHCDGHEAQVAIIEAGDFFGELSLLSDADRTATAEALEDVTLFVVRRDVFAMMMQDDLAIVFRMLRAMGERLGQANRHVRELLERQGRIRLLAEALRRAGANFARTPVAVELDQLAADLGLDRATARTMVAELVQRGAGALEDGRWRFDGAEHALVAVALVRAYAEGRGPTGSPAGPSGA